MNATSFASDLAEPPVVRHSHEYAASEPAADGRTDRHGAGGHDHAHPHPHGRESADAHSHAHAHAHGVPAGRRSKPISFSLVRVSLIVRLGVAMVFSVAVWAAIFWATMPIGAP